MFPTLWLFRKEKHVWPLVVKAFIMPFTYLAPLKGRKGTSYLWYLEFITILCYMTAVLDFSTGKIGTGLILAFLGLLDMLIYMDTFLLRATILVMEEGAAKNHELHGNEVDQVVKRLLPRS